MKAKRIYLSSPHMSGNEMKYIQEAFDQNWIAPLGPNVDCFEDTLAQYCQVKGAAALSSGTAAIHLALILLGIGTGDEVMVSTFTFSASVNPIVYQGAKPVFIDCEELTWNMDPGLLKDALKQRELKGTLERVKAIIVVHLYGMPANMEEIMKIADSYGIPVIEDAAEALGSKYKGRSPGSFGSMGVLSFNGNKIITTSGGGSLLSSNESYITKARFLASQAKDASPYYQHSQLGYNYRLSNVLAGIGRGQMEVIDERVSKRRFNNLYYKEALSINEGIRFLEEPDSDYYSNFWLTTIILDPKKIKHTNLEIIRALEVENIESRPLWKPMHLQPVFSGYEAYTNSTSENLFNNGLCLPSGSNMTEEELERVVCTVKDTVRQYAKINQ